MMTTMTISEMMTATGRAAAEVLSLCGLSFSPSEYTVFPGFCDVHVHFREPGFSYKERSEERRVGK